MKVLFAANWGVDVGMGHFVRCYALAEALSRFGLECYIIGPGKPPRFSNEGPFAGWFSAEGDLGPELVEKVVTCLRRFSFNFLVVDDYRFGEDKQLELKRQGISWLQFDLGPPSVMRADIVVDVKLTFNPKSLEDRVDSKDTLMLGGPEFAPLRSSFSELGTKQRDGTVNRVLLTFGGGDDRGAFDFALSALANGASKNLVFVLVVGAGNPKRNHSEEQFALGGQGSLEVHVSPRNLAEVFDSCDLAIMAGGTTTYEVARCGIPMLLLSIAQNQVEPSEAWAERGGAVFIGPIEGNPHAYLTETFNALLDNPSQVRDMGRINRSISTGDGAWRVSRAIVNEIVNEN